MNLCHRERFQILAQPIRIQIRSNLEQDIDLPRLWLPTWLYLRPAKRTGATEVAAALVERTRVDAVRALKLTNNLIHRHPLRGRKVLLTLAEHWWLGPG